MQSYEYIYRYIYFRSFMIHSKFIFTFLLFNFYSNFFTQMPRCIIWPIAYVSIASLAVELPDHFITTLKFALALVVTAITSTAYGNYLWFLTNGVGVKFQSEYQMIYLRNNVGTLALILIDIYNSLHVCIK